MARTRSRAVLVVSGASAPAKEDPHHLRVPRDKNGWPQAWWSLAGADPEFDLGDRNRAYERGDIFERLVKPRS